MTLSNLTLTEQDVAVEQDRTLNTCWKCSAQKDPNNLNWCDLCDYCECNLCLNSPESRFNEDSNYYHKHTGVSVCSKCYETKIQKM